jgi:hypothetical protein
MHKDPKSSYGAASDFVARTLRSRRTAKEPANCEFLVEGRLCRIGTEDPEFRRVRKKSCKNPRKNYCCYLCPVQEECKISCNYLDAKTESVSDSDYSLRIEEEIKEYDKEKKKLNTLWNEGKIGECSYKTAIDAIEEKTRKLKEVKKRDFTMREEEEVLKELTESPTETEEPTGFWYLVPIFFALIGGIVAYVGLKDEDEDMANTCLIFGFVVSALWILLGVILVS